MGVHGLLKAFNVFTTFIVFVIALFVQRPVFADNKALVLSDEVVLSSLRLVIRFEPSFLASPSVIKKADVLESICEQLGNQLQVGKGPWGFGIFDDKAKCETSGEASVVSDPFLWTLRVGLNSEGVGTVSLCRPLLNGKTPEKCESVVKIPGGRYLVESLSVKKFVRIVAGAVLDKTPFRSKLISSLLNESDEISPFHTPLDKRNSSLQLPAPKYKLVPVVAYMNKKSGLFRVKEIKSSEVKSTLETRAVWLVSSDRGEMQERFVKSIDSARAYLERYFDKKSKTEATAGGLLGRRAREKAKQGKSWWAQLEPSLDIRGGGLKLSAKRYSAGGDIAVEIFNGTFQNVWLEGHFLQGAYETDVVVESADINNTTLVMSSAKRALSTSLGWGVRLYSASDHTFFLYPKIGYTKVDWKANLLGEGLDSSVADASFLHTKLPALGVTVGYSSPEFWPVGLQVRLSAESVGDPKITTYVADIAANLGTPGFAKGMYTSLGAKQGGFTVFTNVQYTTVLSNENSSGTLDELNLSAFDLMLGLGYRLDWR